MTLKDYQELISKYLYFNENEDLVKGLLTKETTDRLAIYYNHLIFSLLGVLEETFFVTRKALEDKNFKYFVREYIQAYPSKDVNIDFYGKSFPSFLSCHDLLEDLPYIEGLAKIDWHVSHRIETSFSAAKGVFDLWSLIFDDNEKELSNIELDFSSTDTLCLKEGELFLLTQ
jgi:hypothetical protein